MSAASSRNDEYDYIIVGAGSAGCVLAYRLTEDEHTRVLLVEAGGHDRHVSVRVPAALALKGDRFDWNYPTEPDASRFGMQEVCNGGKLIGGGSSVNAMCWVRGNRNDYDGWEEMGAKGWGYHSVLPFFRRAENFEGGADMFRGTGGPQQVSFMRVKNKLIPAFLAAGAEAGLPINPDYNGEEQFGVGVGQVSQRNGLRASTARSYLAPAMSRRNLTVVLNGQVTRVLTSNARAVGLEYSVGGRQVTARVRREVILSAGAIGSPKLLMLSGIGPGDVLRQHQIRVVADLPGVGENLMDHPHAANKYEVTESTLNTQLTPLRMVGHGLNFMLTRRGALTTGYNQAIVFGKSPGASIPDIEIQLIVYGFSPKTKTVRRRDGSVAEVTSIGMDERPTITLLPAYLTPSGRGTITLRSSDPLAAPVIRHELIGHPDDFAGVFAAFKLARDICRQPSIRKFIKAEVLPGDGVTTEEDLTNYLRAATFSGRHYSGTCKMGVDERSVVDPTLRVRGVDNLRVVDASVMPKVVRGNTNAATIMIAERAADLIRNSAAEASDGAAVHPMREWQAGTRGDMVAART